MIVTTLLSLYCGAALVLLLYGLNCYVMVYLFRRRKDAASRQRQEVREEIRARVPTRDLPAVTTQIPVFNEYNVAVRAMEAACRMEYPAGRHEIQILDDSTDETRQIIDRAAAWLRAEGHDIHVVRRESRLGFKAGALAEGLRRARGELIAVFDADFVPPADFLLQTVPFLVARPEVGLVQARWGHLNRDHSLLTRAQAIGIDGHFMIEQAARAWNGLMMNFNGTAGVWRRRAIEEAGGWQWDTLTEDMDLSYRTQLAGWKAVYVPDAVVPAEIPEDVQAFKNQQFRWAKGSIQTARKLLPLVLQSPLPWFVKLQAFFHLTHYAVHPFMVFLALFALPVLLTVRMSVGPAVFALVAALLLVATLAPNFLYTVSQRSAYSDWHRRILWLPALSVVGVGIAISNSRAVLEAVFHVNSDFVRTPKRGDVEMKRYRAGAPRIALVEIATGAYCVLSFGQYLASGKILVGPFLFLYAAGFLFIGILSLLHGLGVRDPRLTRVRPKAQLSPRSSDAHVPA